jgi:ribonuclease T2
MSVSRIISAALRGLLPFLLLSLAAAACAREETPGDFDYYVLALSWSPTFCGAKSAQAESEQCAPGRRYAFVVHGLWPQYTSGWPDFCETRERWVDEERIAEMMPIMPSKKLVIHQWRKHGSCSGLSQRDYFALVLSTREGLRIPARYLSPGADLVTTPEQLVEDFVQSNRALTQDMISVQCGSSTGAARLEELRICLDRQGAFAPCGRNERRNCQARTLLLPRVR